MHLSEKAKANEDKFRKMKEVYAKLREEHVALIRTVSSMFVVWVQVRDILSAFHTDCYAI